MTARGVAVASLAVLAGTAAVGFAAIGPSSGHHAKAPEQFRLKSSYFTPLPGSVHVETKVPDPGGDAPWAVRVWKTRDNTQACAQLGRIVNGVVGDAGADGRFRMLKLGERTICSPDVFDRHQPIVQVATFLDDPLVTTAKPVRTVAWGMAGPRVEQVTISGPGGARVARTTPLHAWIDVRPGDVRTYELATEVRYRDGSARTVDYGRSTRPSRQPVPGSVTVEARAPSPDGGPDVGLLAWRTKNGSICSTDGRLLGTDRVGGWGPESTFFDFPIGEGGRCHRSSDNTGYLPVDFSYGFNAGSPAHFSGFARSDVASVIVEGLGPRRELTPGPHGGLLALFPAKAGYLRVSARFKDGRVQHIQPLRITDPARRHLPSGPRIIRITPRVARVARDGMFTVNVTCTRGRRLCMSTLVVRTQKGYRRPHGLTRHFLVAGRLVRVGAGVRDRPLRLRLSERGLGLLRRDGQLRIVISAASWDMAPPRFHVKLVPAP